MIQPGTHATPRMDLGIAFAEYSLQRARLIAQLVLPLLKLAKQAGTIKVTKRKNARIPTVDHADGANYRRVHLYMDDLSFATTDKGLEGQLTDRDREFDTCKGFARSGPRKYHRDQFHRPGSLRLSIEPFARFLPARRNSMQDEASSYRFSRLSAWFL